MTEITFDITILWYTIIIFSCFLIALIIFVIYLYISDKLHISYHKGYNKAKDDKVQYYKTIKEIIDCYDKIFLELTKEGSNYVYKASTLELMLNFRKSLQDYYNNS